MAMWLMCWVVACIKKSQQTLANTTNNAKTLGSHENNMNTSMTTQAHLIFFFNSGLNKNHLLLNMSSYTAVMAWPFTPWLILCCSGSSRP